MSKRQNKLKHRLNAFKNWLQFRKKLFQLWWANAPKSQINLEKGSYYLRLGTIVQVGQPLHLCSKEGKVLRKRYIKNLFFNFRSNKVTCSYSDKPLKGITEQFES